MPDYRTMFDKDYIGAWDLNGKDVIVEIATVKAGELTAQGNKKTKKPIIFMKGKEKGFALNVTNAKIVARLYGNDTNQWIGKRIALFPTTTTFGGQEVDCIRVRPSVPTGKSASPDPLPPPVGREPGDE